LWRLQAFRKAWLTSAQLALRNAPKLTLPYRRA
jgi:hypothetical protein